MAVPIISRPTRGRLYSRVADVLLPIVAQGDTACSCAEVHRLDLADLSGGGR
jgi:hypothetical protein